MNARVPASVLTCAIWFASAALAGEEEITLSKAPGVELTTARCSICHSLDYVQSNAPIMTREAWSKSIRKMIDRFGAPITQSEADTILEYLGTSYSNAPRAQPQ